MLSKFALLLAAAWAKVHTLNKDNFGEFIEENELTLVKFYAPWCGHCKKMEPEYEAASEAITGVKLAKVDCSVEESLASKFEIRGFPTLKFFRKGVPLDYTGGRQTLDIVQWVESMTRPAVVAVADVATAKTSGTAGAVKIIGVAKTDAAFTVMAEANRTLGEWYYVKGDAESVTVVRTDGESTVSLSAEDAVTQIKAETLPLFGPINGETFQVYADTGLDFVWVACAPEDRESFVERIHAAAKLQRGKLNFVYLDTVAFSRQAEGMLGVTTFPAIVRTHEGPGRWVLKNSDASVAEIGQWIADINDKKISVELKSEDVPASNDEPVKIVVGSEFSKMVTDEEDTLLLIYAPWCGHCKKMAPDFEEVATKLQELSPKIKLAKIDGTANEIPVEGYSFQGFPTLYFKKAGESVPVPYTGGRTTDEMLAFLSENASNTFAYTAEAPKEDNNADEEL